MINYHSVFADSGNSGAQVCQIYALSTVMAIIIVQTGYV